MGMNPYSGDIERFDAESPKRERVQTSGAL